MKTHYGIRVINTSQYILKFHIPVPLCRPSTKHGERYKFGAVPDCKPCKDRLEQEGGEDNLCITIKYPTEDKYLEPYLKGGGYGIQRL